MARRLVLTYLLITALTLAVVVVPLGRVFADREQSRLTAEIERDAQAVASLVEDDLEAGTPPGLGSTLSGYRATGGRIVVTDAMGRSVADSDDVGGAPRDFSTRPEVASALEGRRASGTRASETLGTDLLFVAIPVASGGAVHGTVRITYPTSEIDARIRATWWRLALLSLVVLVLVAVVGVVFAQGVSRPVRRLRLASERLAAGDLRASVEVGDGAPELRALATTFNRTAAQLAQLVESQRRFVADAAHQLRTPLTALRLRLETLAPDLDETARPKLDAAVAETHRLGRLVESLLVLARTDAVAPDPVPVHLAAVIADRWEAWSPVAADQGARLERACPPDLWVLAVPGALEQILDNLVSNALEVAPDGSAISIGAAVVGDRVEVHVVDQGPGLEADARSQAFERFWRGAGGATADGDGFGLGLAIVAQLATRSGGAARLDAGPAGTGLDAVVTLARADLPTFA